MVVAATAAVVGLFCVCFLCGGSGVNEIVHIILCLLPPDLNLRRLFSYESALAAYLFMQDIIFSSRIISLGTFFISV